MKNTILAKLSIVLFIIACFLGSCSVNKKMGSRFFSCDYYESTSINSSEIFKIINGSKVKSEALDSLINLLTSLSFPYKGFEVAFDNTGKVEVAKAVIDNLKGYRYIIININKFKNVNLNNPNEFASVLGVLAHELAHLTYSHARSNHNNELLADRYAGWMLKKLGISRGYCIQSLDDYLPQGKIEETSTHPSKGRRIEAMLAGWDRAEVDSRIVYSVCCDTSFYSSFMVEGLFLEKAVNEGNLCFIDFTITLYNEKGGVVQEFDKKIMNHLGIKPEVGKPIILFKNSNYVILDKRFYKIGIGICECGEPCDGINDARECPTLTEILRKDIEETLKITFADYGYMTLRFKK